MSEHGFAFTRTRRADFPQLQTWLEKPHVARFWNHRTSDTDIEQDFGGSVDGTEPSEDFIVSYESSPIGFIQRYRLQDYPDDLALLERLVPIPAHTISIDYFIGEAALIGKGVGSAMIRAFVEKCRDELPHATAVIVPVVVANRASWRALEKAGFHRVGEGSLPPDNPIDDGAHFISGLDLHQR